MIDAIAVKRSGTCACIQTRFSEVDHGVLLEQVPSLIGSPFVSQEQAPSSLVCEAFCLGIFRS